MIVALLLGWIAFTAFAVSGLAWLEPRRARPSSQEPATPLRFSGPDEHFELAVAEAESEPRSIWAVLSLG
jgi:hypothetical protein